ncbi:glycosyltransferase family 32 protein [Fistulina hepatica ATCC 64428]|uniref:Glycosyltransferase family 32 protein n=1 Tax=Fistulina hepatica ATCC 64428 TaxID=1128425 RepID=A0A0D7AAF3_9AGAR|nr:glycosyltransferase family 32 protein [Fistulina hepatica ATCC 64428]
MSSGGYDRLPMYALRDSTPRLRSSSLKTSSFARYAFRHDLDNNDADDRHTRRRTHRSRPSLLAIRPRTLFAFLKYALPVTVLLILYVFYTYQLHIEIAFYNRKWIEQEITTLKPLSGCFDDNKQTPIYNVTEYVYGPKRTEVQAGIPLKMGMDCYDFAGTIQGRTMLDPYPAAPPDGPVSRTQYHTYWRADLAPFGPRQEWMLKSFFATQNAHTSQLILWSNGDLSSNEILQKYLRKYSNAFVLRQVDISALAQGTALSGSSLLLQTHDSKAWVDGDLIRLLLLWNYGGVWIDMDSLLTRDLEPLLEHEFVTQWDCYDKDYTVLNGALMRFRERSPYLCEAFHIMATAASPRPGSTDWGSVLYHKLWRRLVAAGVPPFKVLPFCFSDGRSCRLDNRLPDPFLSDDQSRKGVLPLGGFSLEEGGRAEEILLNKIFSVHLHNQWGKAFPEGGWVERLLLRRYDRRLAEAT